MRKTFKAITMEHTERYLPEEGTEVTLFTVPPTCIVDAVYKRGIFHVQNHWSLKEVRPEQVQVWEYKGQGI